MEECYLSYVGNNVDIGSYIIYLVSCLLFYYVTTKYLCEIISDRVYTDILLYRIQAA